MLSAAKGSEFESYSATAESCCKKLIEELDVDQHRKVLPSIQLTFNTAHLRNTIFFSKTSRQQ